MFCKTDRHKRTEGADQIGLGGGAEHADAGELGCVHIGAGSVNVPPGAGSEQKEKESRNETDQTIPAQAGKSRARTAG